MKPIRSRHVPAVLLAPLLASVSAATIDGILDGGEGYTPRSVQSVVSNWGANNSLANLHTAQDGNTLSVFLGGRCEGNAMILFIDSKPGGAAFIPDNLITSGGEEGEINRMGGSPTSGLTFESGFLPDHAIRVYGDATDSYVRRYDLQAGTGVAIGETVHTLQPASGFVRKVRTTWQPVAGAASSVVHGVEFELGIPELGVPQGTGQPLKLMALLVNNDSSYGSNQVLGSKTGTDDIGGAGGVMTPYDFGADPAVQTISLTVDNNDTDGDGIPNDIDPDDDGDDLPDTDETNTGVFIDANDTGSDPLVADTDGDGANDGVEVLFNAFGFQTDPNKPNYATMAVAGSFTDPVWQVDGSAGNAMVLPAPSFAGQFDWSLDYKIGSPGEIQYKFAADGSYDNSWGDGGFNITAIIAASGIHTFAFNNDTLTRSLTRRTFADVGGFLAAYGLSAGGDEDNDGIPNENEFTANTDPTRADTDGDGLDDDVDPVPLAATRDVVFRVDMSVQETLGNFDPEGGAVVVKFFTGLLTGLPDLVLTEEGDTGVYSGTLAALAGPPAADSGGYKFFNTSPGAPNGGYEEGFDRTFVLDAGNATQTLPTVHFSNIESTPGYQTWSAANAGGQGAGGDFDNDGVPNGVEYFMGVTGNGFTAMPKLQGGSITWPRDPSANATFRVWTTGNFTSWTDVTESVNTTDPNQLVYTHPATAPALFIRLEVIVP